MARPVDDSRRIGRVAPVTKPGISSLDHPLLSALLNPTRAPQAQPQPKNNSRLFASLPDAAQQKYNANKAASKPSWIDQLIGSKKLPNATNLINNFQAKTPTPKVKATIVSPPRPINVAGPARNGLPAPRPVGAAPRGSAPAPGGGRAAPSAGASSQGGVHPASSAIAQMRNNMPPANDPNSDANLQLRAANAVDVNLTPQEQALQQQGKSYNDAFNYTQGQNAANTQRTVNEQQDVYSRLHDMLNNQMPAIGQNYDNATHGVDSNFGKLQSALSSNYGSGIADTTSEVNRLGLQPALPDATARMTSDQSFLKGLAGSDQALLDSNLGTSKASALQNSLYNIGAQGATGAALTGNTLRDASNVSNQASFANTQKVQDLLAQASTLEGTRKGLTAENLAKLQGLRSEQQASAQQAAQQQANEDRKYAIQAALAQGSLSKDQADVLFKQGDLALRQQLGQSTIAGDTAKLGLTKAQQDKTNIDAAKTLYDQAHPKPTGPTNYGKGIPGAQAYLNANYGPKISAIALHAVVNIASHNHDLGGVSDGAIKDGRSVVGYASAVQEMRNIASQHGYDVETTQAMINALAYAAGRA
jgi:hypothetical protein